MSSHSGTLAIRRSKNPIGRRSLQDALDYDLKPDPHTPAQRDAIERKRAANEERDQRRFLRETAHMVDEEFLTLPGDDHPLIAGLGKHRDAEMTMRWLLEPGRRAKRTGHEILTERRLYCGS